MVFSTGKRTAFVDVSLDFPSIAANTSAELTATVTGAKLGAFAYVAVPTTFNDGLVAMAYVSAAETVTVRVANVTVGAIDPAASTFRVGVVYN